ncbi:MAG: diguanylate cyclase [Deltaproteobacteria bacterium]|nr:diguanylate cyclase [Deltaproteobacteria bacterium]
MTTEIHPLVNVFIDTSFDAAALVGPDLEVLHYNRAYLQLAELSPRAMKKDPHARMCHEHFGLTVCEKDGCLSQRAMETGKSIRIDEVGSSKRDLTVNLLAIPLVDERLHAYACIEIYRDVTAESRMQNNYKGLLDRERRRAELLQQEVQRRTADLHRANEALNRALQQVSTLARTDPLTMLHNRRVFDEQLTREVQRAIRFKREMSLVVIDLDHFKQVNDKLGHQAGDDALRTVSRILTAQTRTVDTVARIGGEEFALVLPETNVEDAMVVVDRLRRTQETDGLHTTFSAGVAACPRHAVSEEELFKAADRALYTAKGKGRNRVEMFR